MVPLHSFCLGLKTAVLSMVRYHPDVQQAIDVGLTAAAAQHQDGLLRKLSGKPPSSPLARQLSQQAQQAQQAQQLKPNGYTGAATQAAAGVQPMPGMLR